MRAAGQARPTRAELEASAGRTIPDLVAPGLELVFCGINPGLYSGYTGWHFARPGNRFYPALALSRLTARELSPSEGDEMLAAGLGVTNLVTHATAAASELSSEQLRAGVVRLERLVTTYRPRAICVLGLGAYRQAFSQREAQIGEQPGGLATARVFLIANPSGLQARYQLGDLVAQLEMVRDALGLVPVGDPLSESGAPR
jgi:double-stranded uracil-DNA glycosylase